VIGLQAYWGHEFDLSGSRDVIDHVVTSHLGDKPSRRQSSRRQTNSATRVGQLGDNLFRLSVCFVLIEQNKLSKKAVLSQGNHAMLHSPHNISRACPTEWVRIRRGGHSNTWYCSLISSGRHGAWSKAYSIRSVQFLLLFLRLQQVPTVGVFLFVTHRLECNVR